MTFDYYNGSRMVLHQRNPDGSLEDLSDQLYPSKPTPTTVVEEKIRMDSPIQQLAGAGDRAEVC